GRIGFRCGRVFVWPILILPDSGTGFAGVERGACFFAYFLYTHKESRASFGVATPLFKGSRRVLK
ncbi:MAG: hypothetical protein C0624_10960, partial [Desulfuromonas sp.]